MSQCSKVNGQQSEFNSHVVTTVPRQAVECEARNPCIHDHEDIKSAEGTTEKLFCRTFGALIFFKTFLCRYSALCAPSPAYCLSLLRSLFGCYMDFWVLDFWIFGCQWS